MADLEAIKEGLQDLHGPGNNSPALECKLQADNDRSEVSTLNWLNSRICSVLKQWHYFPICTTCPPLPLFRVWSKDVPYSLIPYYVGHEHLQPPGQFYRVPTPSTVSPTIRQVNTNNYYFANYIYLFLQLTTLLTTLPSPPPSTDNRFVPPDNATRYCHLNGRWDNYTNYDSCRHISESGDDPGDFDAVVELSPYIYCLGYLLSLLSLVLAVIVFVRFKYVVNANLYVIFPRWARIRFACH